MAIDTKEKRANIPGVGRPWMRDKFPVATPDEQWRIASGLTYGGNALSATVPAVETGAVDGTLSVAASVRGRLSVKPSVGGDVSVVASVGGRLEVKP